MLSCPLTLSVRGASSYAIVLNLSASAVDSGETVFIDSSSLEYTHTTTSCGVLEGPVAGSALLPHGANASGYGVLRISTCPSPGRSAWELQRLNLGGFTMQGVEILAATVNASRSSGSVRWGELTLLASALLGGTTRARITGVGSSRATTPTAAWALNVSLAVEPSPALPLDFSLPSAPLLFDTSPKGAFAAIPSTPCATAGVYLGNGTRNTVGRAALAFNASTGFFLALGGGLAHPLALGPILLNGSAAALYAQRGVGVGAKWRLYVNFTGSAPAGGPSINVTSFAGVADSSTSFVGSGTLFLSASGGDAALAARGAATATAFALLGVGSFTFNSTPMATPSKRVGQGAKAPPPAPCTFAASGSPTLSVWAYLSSSAEGQRTFTGTSAGDKDTSATELSYECPSPGGLGGGWQVAFSDTLYTPAYSYKTMETITYKNSRGEKKTKTEEVTVDVKKKVGLQWGPVVLGACTVSLSAAPPTPSSPSAWSAAITGWGTLATDSDIGAVVAYRLRTTAPPFSVGVSAVLAGGGGTSSTLPFFLNAGTPSEPVAFRLINTTTTTTTTTSRCYAFSTRLNATLTTGMVLYSPTSNATYDSCSGLTPWNISSSMASEAVRLAVGVTLFPTFMALRGGNGSWSGAVHGMLSLGATPAVATCNATATLPNTTSAGSSSSSPPLTIACRDAAAPALLTSAPFSASNAVRLSGNVSTLTVDAAGCIRATAFAPTLQLSYPGILALNATLPNMTWASCPPPTTTTTTNTTTTTTTTTTTPTGWSAGPLKLPSTTLGDVRLSSVSLALTNAQGSTSTWAVRGTAAAVLGSSSTTGAGMGASPAAVVFGTPSPASPFAATITADIAMPAFALSLALEIGPTPPRAPGACTPISGRANVTLLFTVPPLNFPAPRAVYNPCSGGLTLGASGLPGTLVGVGGGSLEVSGVALTYSPAGGGWVGTLGGGSSTDGSPAYYEFSGAGTTRAGIAGTSVLTAGAALVFPGFGRALLAPATPCTGSGGSALATYTVIALSLSNMGVALPNVTTAGGGTATVSCKDDAASASGGGGGDSQVGRFTLTQSLPGPFAPFLGGSNASASSPTLASPVLTIARSGEGALTYTFSGTAAAFGGVAVTLVLDGTTGQTRVSSTATASRRELLLGGGEYSPPQQQQGGRQVASTTYTLKDYLSSCDFSTLPSSAYGGTTLKADIVDVMGSAVLSAVSVGTDDAGCMVLSGSMGGSVWGAGGAGAGVRLSAASCPAGCTVSVALDLAAMTGLPPALGLGSLDTTGLVKPTFTIGSSSVAFTAEKVRVKGLVVSNLVLSFASAAGGANYSASGSGTCTLSGVATTVSATRAASGEWSLALGIDTTASALPFKLTGTLAYDGNVSSGTISTLRLSLGSSRSLTLVPSSTPATVAFSGADWFISCALPGGNFGGVAVEALIFTASKTGEGGAWDIGLVGAASMGGLAAQLEVEVSPSSSSYAVALTASVATPTLSMGLTAALTSGDSPACALFSGAISSLSLSLGRAGSVSLTSGISVDYSTCDGSLAIVTQAPSQVTVLGLAVTLSSLTLTRESPSSGWEGELVASVVGGLLPLPNSWKSTQSFTLAFSDSSLSSAVFGFTASKGSDFSMAATMEYTPTALCAADGSNTAVAVISGSIPTPFGAKVALSGSGTISRSCSGSGAFTASLASDPLTLDIGSASVKLTDVVLMYAKGGGASGGDGVITLAGTVGGAVAVALVIDTSGAVAQSTLSATMNAPASVENVITALSGPQGKVGSPAMLGPVLKGTITDLDIYATSSGVSKCLFMAAAADGIFGGSSVSVSANLCKQGTGFSGTLGVLVDASSMRLPGAARFIFKYLPNPSITLSFGAPPTGTAVGSPILPPSAALAASAAKAAAGLPVMLAGSGGACFSGSLAAAGNGIVDFMGAIGSASPGLGVKVQSALRSVYVSACIAGVADFTVSAAFAPEQKGLSAGGGVALDQMAVFSRVTELGEAVGISAVISAPVGKGSNRQVLVAACELMLERSPSGLPILNLAAAFYLEGGNGNWKNPFGMGKGVEVLMPIIGQFGFSVIPAPPFVIPTTIGFAGGLKIGTVSFYMALLADVADVRPPPHPHRQSCQWQASSASLYFYPSHSPPPLNSIPPPPTPPLSPRPMPFTSRLRA